MCIHVNGCTLFTVAHVVKAFQVSLFKYRLKNKTRVGRGLKVAVLAKGGGGGG